MRAARFACGAIALAMIAWYGPQIVIRTQFEHQYSRCSLHMAQLRDAVMAYSDEHGGAFPPAGRWCDALLPYVKEPSVFVCPAAQNQTCSYALNAAVAGLRRADMDNAGEVVLLFESDAGWNQAGGPELLPAVPRHWGREYLVFADGSGGTQPRKHRGRDHRSLREVKPWEWIKQYPAQTRPVEWVPRIHREPG